MSVIRFGVSLEKDYLDSLDDYILQNKLSNRSQAIRQLINRNLVKNKWASNDIVAGSITLVYDHHKHNLSSKLTDIQHDYHELILSLQHFHLDKSLCMEIIAVKGRALEISELADKLIAVKGINHGQITMTLAE
jgi:CopG family nickel-responsive transcriptional regulator